MTPALRLAALAALLLIFSLCYVHMLLIVVSPYRVKPLTKYVSVPIAWVLGTVSIAVFNLLTSHRRMVVVSVLCVAWITAGLLLFWWAGRVERRRRGYTPPKPEGGS